MKAIYAVFSRAFVLIAVICLALPEAAFAAAPNIGGVMREVEQARPQPQRPVQPETPPITVEQEPELSMPAGQTLFVKSFRVEGSDIAPEAEIQAALEYYKNKYLTIAQIFEAAGVVSQLYRDRGYMLAKAYVPRQDASQGELRMVVVVGQHGAVEMQNESLVSDVRLHGIFSKHMPPGEFVKRGDVERAMLLISDLPGVKMPTMSIAPGADPGTSDFNVLAEAENRLGGYIIADNYGSRYTGRWRLSGGLDVNSPFGAGDKLSFSGMASQNADLLNGRVDYSLPVGFSGLRTGLALSHVTYELGKQYSVLDATGNATTLEAYGSYPVIRARGQNLYLNANAAGNFMEDRIDALDQKTPKRSVTATLGAFYELWLEPLARPLYFSVDAGITGGYLSITDDDEKYANKLGPDTTGGFYYFHGTATANYNFLTDFNFIAVARAQRALNGKNLDSSEQMNISGVGGVRVYRESVMGDNAYVLSAELRYQLPAIAEFSHALGVFWDHGHSSFQDASYSYYNGVTISDAGLAYYANYKKLILKVEAAKAIGGHPSAVEKEDDVNVMAQFGLVF